MDFRQILAQLSLAFEKLTILQRSIITGVFIAAIGLLVFIILRATSPTHEGSQAVLFDNLSARDSAAIVAELKKRNVAYSLKNETTILVPKKVVYEERIAVASLGLPKDDGVGFELFDKQEFGATKFDQNVKFLRALEGELERTITTLQPIVSTSVNLAIPKESLFITKEQMPTASVMIDVDPSARLTNRQIRGIKNLVAAAVPKLQAANVVIVNSMGETLGENDELAQISELTASQQKYKQMQQRQKEQKIVKALARFIGSSERVVANVNIEYDFSQQSSTSETFDPENVVRSEQSVEEKREGAAPKEVGGVPGTVSNIGPVQGLKSQKSNEKYSKNSATTNYEVSVTRTKRKGSFAKLKRMTAAVVVDGKYQANAEGEQEYIPLDETQIAAITDIVKRSIGYDKERGDEISVKNFQFESSKEVYTTDQGAITVAKSYLFEFLPLLKYLAVFILLFILYKKVIAPFAQEMLEVTKEEESIERPKLDIEDDEEEDLVEKVQSMRKKVEDQLGVGDNFNEDDLKHEVLLEKVRVISDDRPEEMAALLQALIDEETSTSNPQAPKE